MLLARDKRKGLYQVVEDERFKNFSIILGIADKMREAWVLNGFVAKDDTERKMLDSLKSELALDPVKEAHRLRAPNKSGTRNPKCFLARLTGEDLEREACCWRETPLDKLRQRGKDTGLEAYLDNLRNRLIPLLDHRA